VRNQLTCGDCWAVSAAGVLGDRLAIQGRNTSTQTCSTTVVLSPEDLVMCDTTNGQMGCKGGSIEYAWKFIEQQGIVNESCMPIPVSNNGKK